jgi:hypothetical protein
MRVIDIGVATGYAILCISLISLMSPYPAEGPAAAAEADARAAAAINSYVQTVGLQFLSTAPVTAVCSSFVSASNASVVLGGVVDGTSCGPAPADFIGSATLVLGLSSSQVEIRSWVAEP